MLILLSLIVYLVLGIPFVTWLAHRLAQAGSDHAAPTTSEAEAMPG